MKKFLEKLVESFIIYYVAFSLLVALVVMVIVLSPFLVFELVIGRRLKAIKNKKSNKVLMNKLIKIREETKGVIYE